jgi:hypothetical protein
MVVSRCSAMLHVRRAVSKLEYALSGLLGLLLSDKDTIAVERVLATVH